MTQSPDLSSRSTRNVVRSLKSSTTKNEVEKTSSSRSTSANTPGDGTTKMSLRGTTIYSAPSVDTTMVENASGYLMMNSVESTNPVESVIVDSGNNKMVRMKRKRAQSGAAVRSSDELMAAVQKLIKIPSSQEQRKDESGKVFCSETYYKIADKEPRKVPRIIDSTGRSALKGLHHNDVLLGRGRGASNFSGNLAFRCLVWDYKPTYCNSTRREKIGIACQLVGEVMRQKPPGRFVDMIDDEYFIVPFERAVEKAAQALRQLNLQPQQRMERRQKETKKRKSVPASEAKHASKAPKKARIKRTLSEKAVHYENTSEENSLQFETRTSKKASHPEPAPRVPEPISGADAVEWLESSPCPAADVLAVSPSPSVWYVRPPPVPDLGYVPPKLPYPISSSMNYFLKLRLAEMEIVRNQQVSFLRHG